MKKRLALAAVGLALAGAAAVPAGSAFGLTPRQAARCAQLDAQRSSYVGLLASTDPVVVAIATKLDNRAAAKQTALGCP